MNDNNNYTPYLDMVKASVETEYEEYRETKLQQSKQDIYFSCGEIYFFENIYDYFADCEIDEESCKLLIENDGHIIKNMWNWTLGVDGVSFIGYEDTRDLVEEYINELRYQSEDEKDNDKEDYML